MKSIPAVLLISALVCGCNPSINNPIKNKLKVDSATVMVHSEASIIEFKSSKQTDVYVQGNDEWVRITTIYTDKNNDKTTTTHYYQPKALVEFKLVEPFAKPLD